MSERLAEQIDHMFDELQEQIPIPSEAELQMIAELESDESDHRAVSQNIKRVPREDSYNGPALTAEVKKAYSNGVACRPEDQALFFQPIQEGGEDKESRRKREEKAKAICKGCVALIACREYALENKEKEGIWGGMTARERSIFNHNRAFEGKRRD